MDHDSASYETRWTLTSSPAPAENKNRSKVYRISTSKRVETSRASTSALAGFSNHIARNPLLMAGLTPKMRSSCDTPTCNRDLSPMRNILNLAVQNIAANGARIFWNWSERRSYPSRRPCPSCGGIMTYLASRWGHRHTRTCESCGYSDKSVTIITQI